MIIIHRAEGMATQEQMMAEAMTQSSDLLKKSNMEYSHMLFSQWMESMKYIAQHGEGNVIFFDGSTDAFDKGLKHIQAISMQKEK